MNRDKSLLLIVILLFSALTATWSRSASPETYIVKIAKTGESAGVLSRHPDLVVLAELDQCYLALADFPALSRLRSASCRYETLGMAEAEGERLFMLKLRDSRRLPELAVHGLAVRVEKEHILFQPDLVEPHPLRIVPRLIQRIKKLTPGAVTAPSPLPETPVYDTQPPAAANPQITVMANQVSRSNLESNIRDLQNFGTRDAETDGCRRAGDYLYNRLSQSNLQVSFDTFNFEGLTSRNVIGYQQGQKTPGTIVIICAHYDSYSESGGAAPGADDNGSGTAAVLEAARILSQYRFNYSIKYILFSAEEWGLYGSAHYAREAKNRGETIAGVVNMDMISYTDRLPEDLDVIVNSASQWMGAVFQGAARDYSSIQVAVTVDGSYDYSDHSPFWDRGYPAVLCIEDYEDTNPWYHSAGDTLSTINLDFAAQAARVCLAVTAGLAVPAVSVAPSITVTSPNGGERWKKGSVHAITWTSGGTVGPVKISWSANNGASWTVVVASTANDGSYNWTVPNTLSSQNLVKISEASDNSPSDASNQVFSIVSESAPVISLSRKRFNFGAVERGSASAPQSLRIGASGGTLRWRVSDNAAWLSCSPSSGVNSGTITITVSPAGLNPGVYTGTISILCDDAANSPQIATATLTIKRSGQNGAPFGEFATPVNGASVSGSVPVTGWALDDTGIASVRVYRDNVRGMTLIGDAILIEGARPDVETAYPDYPGNHKAGWGYMLLTNLLPNQGNGTFTLRVTATDAAGRQTSLGAKTIVADNARAVKPFGAIDTPEQGGTVTGTSFVNWGWVLTPQPCKIPTNGSTLNVWVDGVNLGHPHYNNYRPDIASLFPGYANSNGASGYFTLDAGRYADGLHTIQWTATDTGGHTDGIGSRYFIVSGSNNRNPEPPEREDSADIAAMRPHTPILPIRHMDIRKGFNRRPPNHPGKTAPDATYHVALRELEPLEIRFRGHYAHIAAYTESNGALLPAPPGSTINTLNGTFSWSPGPGFQGAYRLLFILREPSGNVFQRGVSIFIAPASDSAP